MKHQILILIILLSLLSLPLGRAANAENDGLSLEAEQNWDTYMVGGTCISGTHNIFVADIDRDGVKEIMTGGSSYNIINGSRTISQAPLKVWTWNTQNITLKASTNWYGTISCLYAADVDSDGKVDILTGGSFRNETGNSTSSLRAWNLNNQLLSLKAHYEGVPVTSIFVSDVDLDGTFEILTIGRLATNSSELCLWHIQGNNLTLYQRLSLTPANVTRANSVYASDLDNDGNVEIMVGGYSDTLSNSKGLLSIWQWKGQEFTLKANKTWQLCTGTAKTIAGGIQGNTAVNNVKVGDLDGDGIKEVVTGGFAYDGANVSAQIKVWCWDGSNLTEKASQEWATDYLTEAKCISLNDVNGDGKLDIVQSGITAAEGSFKNTEAPHDRGQLRVWSYNGTDLTLTASKDWTFDEGTCAWNVANGDVDNDGVTEIITVGCTALNTLCDPDMRIWSLPIKVNAYPNYLIYYALAAVLLVTGAFSIVYLYLKKAKPRT